MLKVVSKFAAAGLLAIAIVPVAEAQTRIEKKFDDWLVVCQEKEGKTSCAISQTLTNAEKQLVLSFAISRGDGGTDGTVIRTPVGTLLPNGVTITAGAGSAQKAEFRFCGPRACFAQFPFDETWLAAFRRETEASVSYTMSGGKEVTLKVSLKGFTAAHDFYDEALAGSQPPPG